MAFFAIARINFQQSLSISVVNRQAFGAKRYIGLYSNQFKLPTTGCQANHSTKQLMLRVSILPIVGNTPFTYFLYSLILISGLFNLRYLTAKKPKKTFDLQQEEELNSDVTVQQYTAKLKDELSAIILVPIDKLMKQFENTEHYMDLLMINFNVRRVLNTINQNQNLAKKLQVIADKQSDNIVEVIKNIVELFSETAKNKQITVVFNTTKNVLLTDFDHINIEKIVYRLLLKALACTEEKGQISVQLSFNKNSNYEEQLLMIKVSSTGNCIFGDRKKAEISFNQNLVFDAINNQDEFGKLTELVTLNNGVLYNGTDVEKQNYFCVLLPVSVKEEVSEPFLSIFDSLDTVLPVAAEPEIKKKFFTAIKKASILLVETDEAFSFYLKENLKVFFDVIEAKNGKEAWQKVLAMHPGLVVSIIDIPEINGINLLEKIKNDVRTSHTPVILLSSGEQEEEQLKALTIGASDYLIKPFKFEILLSKIRNFMELQNILKKTYQKQLILTPAEPVTATQDEVFMQYLLRLIEQKMADPNLSIEELSSNLAMSRVTLYRKVLLLTGKTPVEFLKQIRLQRSAQLLQKKQINIAEVAYQVGFNNPKYFSKLFKIAYNVLPTEYKNHQDHIEIN